MRHRQILPHCLIGLCLSACLDPTVAPRVNTVPPSDASAPQSEQSVLQFAQGTSAETQQFLRMLDGLYRQDPALLAGRVRSNALAVQSASRASPLRPELSLVGQTIGSDALSLQLRQPLFDFGRREAEVAQLQAQRQVSEQGVDEVRHALLSEALIAMEAARFAKQRIALHRRQIKDYGDARVAAQQLVYLNLAAASELRLAEVEQQKAQIDLDLAQQDLADAGLVWQGLFPNTDIPTTVEPGALRRASGIAQVESAVQVAATSNLTVRDLQAERQLLQTGRDLEDRNYLPSIGVVAGADLLNIDDNPLSVGLTLDVPLLNRDRTDALTQLDAEVSANMAEIAVQKRDIAIVIQRAAQQSVSATALARSQRRSQALLQQRVEDVDQQVRNGLAKYTDVIEARVAVFEAELNALINDHEGRLAETEIILTTGVLVPLNTL